MSPSAPFPYSGNKAHRNSVAFSEFSTRTVPLRCREDMPDLFFSELGRVPFLPARNETWVLPGIMAFTTYNILWPALGPMPFTTDLGHHLWRAGLTFRAVPMTLSIRHVFLRCSPIKIARGVISRIAILMRAMRPSFWLGSIERLTNKAVRRAGNFAGWDAKDVCEISAPAFCWR